jgi:ABC-2 type transport system permease protein
VLAALLAYGCCMVAFAGLSITLVIRRENAVLKRLRSTPLTPTALIAALFTSTLLVFAVQTVVMFVLGRVVFGTPFPDRVGSIIATIILGVACFTALGVGLSGVVRSAEGSSAVVNAIYLPMAFIAGSFWSPHAYPRFLEVIANVLPLTYFIRMVRDIVLRDAQIWDEGTAVAVLAAWGAVGLFFALRRFRWEPQDV